MRTYISNSFSIQMIPNGGNLNFRKIDAEIASQILNCSNDVSNVIGHLDTNNIVSNILSQAGTEIYAGQRKSVQLQDKDVLIVAQYSGPRLPEGATALPEGARIEFWRVSY